MYAVELAKTRRARLNARRRAGSQRALHIGALALGMASVLAAGFALAALPSYFFLTTGLPTVDRLEELLDPTTGELLQPTHLYDRSGETLILTLSPEDFERRFVSAPDLPWLAKAYIASNQPDFWQTSKFEWTEATKPPDTIVEHLVARLLLPSEPRGWLKNIRTNLLAADALERYSRDKILTWALNSTDFGHWAFGAESAAQLYFGKAAAELTLAESALLAAVSQAPALNPIDAPELTIRFQRLVLSSMWEQGLITDAELSEAVAQPLVFRPAGRAVSLAPDFTELAIEQLEAELGHERVVSGGLEVTTTLDFSLQQEIAALVSDKISLAITDPVNNRLLAAMGNVNEPQPARSVWSPFVYLSAFAQGKAPASLAWDLSRDATPSHGPVTLRQALANNLLKIETSLLNDPSINRDFTDLMQLFSNPTTKQEIMNDPLEMALAYGVLSQNGLGANTLLLMPKTILFAARPDESIELDLTRTDWQAIASPELAYLVTDILSDTTYWPNPAETSRAAAVFAYPNQPWTVAFSQQRVVVLRTESGSNTDGNLWASFFEAAHRDLPIKDWEVPAGLSSVIVCTPSGLLPDDDCPETRREWFLRGNEPRGADDLYQRIAINSLNGKLATVFTPEEFVQERVYLTVPPEGEAWANATGISLPPQDYDPVSGQVTDESLPTIEDPPPFTEVSGMVEIVGSLGTDAVRYDVQVGQGLRPSRWLLLTEGRTTLRTEAFAEWDTKGLSGVWAIQLQAWDAEGRLTRAYTIVTIKP